MCALIAYEKALTEFERYHEQWPPISWKVARRLRLFVITSTVTFRDVSLKLSALYLYAAVIFIVSEVLVIHLRGWSVIHNSYCGNNKSQGTQPCKRI